MKIKQTFQVECQCCGEIAQWDMWRDVEIAFVTYPKPADRPMFYSGYTGHLCKKCEEKHEKQTAQS